jgi:hypothetical protein
MIFLVGLLYNRLQLLVLESYKVLIFLCLLRKISDWYRFNTRVSGACSEKILRRSPGEER